MVKNNEKQIKQNNLSKVEMEYLLCQMFKVDLKNKVELNKGGITIINKKRKITLQLKAG